MCNVVAGVWETAGERREALLGATALALGFGRWRTLVREQGLGDERAAQLLAGRVRRLMRG